jgi:hypothetical protein
MSVSQNQGAQVISDLSGRLHELRLSTAQQDARASASSVWPLRHPRPELVSRALAPGENRLVFCHC